MQIHRQSDSHRSKSGRGLAFAWRTIGAAGITLVLGAISPAAFGQQNSGNTGPKQTTVKHSPKSSSASQGSQALQMLQLQEVVVTGTLLHNQAPVGASLISIGRSKIAETGAQTMQQILASVPALTSFGTAGQGQQGSFDGSGSFAPTIHGLGSSASNGTLVLIDGHRMVPVGINHSLPDPNIIAPLMVKSVQVLANGASSTYGSDAVAGVINIITRTKFKGFEASGQYSFANGYNSENGGLLWGDTFGNTSVIASINYERRSALAASQRAFSANPNHTAEGGANFANYECGPAGVQVGHQFYLYPYTNGPATTAPCGYSLGFASAAGDLLPEEARTDAMIKISHAVNRHVSFNGDLVYSNDSVHTAIARGAVSAVAYGPGSSPPGGPGQINPYFQGPPGVTSETVYFDGDPLLGVGGAEQNAGVKTIMANARMYVNFGHHWQATVATTIGQSDSQFDQLGALCTSCAILGINGTTNPGGDPLTPSIPGTTTTVTNLPLTDANALNVWSPTAAGTSPAVLAALTDSAVTQDVEQAMKDVSVKFDGPLFHMPAGSVQGAIGAEYQHYRIDEQFNQPNNTGPAHLGTESFLYNWGRDVKSVFAEVLVPIVGRANQMTMLKELTFDISGRIDDYSDVGSTKNPRFAVNWKPTRTLIVRADYSRSFAAPNLMSTGDNGLDAQSGFGGGSVVNNLSIPNTFPGAIGMPGCTAATPECVIGTPEVTGMQLNGPNAKLKPETGKSWSLGFGWSPSRIAGLHVDATYWNVRYDGMITSPLAQFAVSSPELSPLLTLYPNGATPAQLAAAEAGAPQLGAVPNKVYWIYNFEQQNAINLRADGVDGNVEYMRPTPIGTLSVDLSESIKLKMMQQFGSGGKWFSVLNTDGYNTTFPSNRLSASLDLGWARGNWNVHLITNYEGWYYNWNGAAPYPIKLSAGFTPIGGGQHIPALTIVNAYATYIFPRDSFLAGTQVSLTVDNLFDRNPPFYNTAFGYDGNAANPIGRMATFAVTERW